TLALIVGLVVGKLLHPGRGFNVDPATLDPSVAAGFAQKAAHGGTVAEYLLHLIPETFFGALAEGQLLQVLVIAVLTGFACTRLAGLGDKAAGLLEDVSKIFFAIVGIIVRLAPIGAFGAMAFTIGKYGVAALVNLAALVGVF